MLLFCFDFEDLNPRLPHFLFDSFPFHFVFCRSHPRVLLISQHHNICGAAWLLVDNGALPFPFVASRSISISHIYGPVSHAIHRGGSSQHATMRRNRRGGVLRGALHPSFFSRDTPRPRTSRGRESKNSGSRDDLGAEAVVLLHSLILVGGHSVLVELQLINVVICAAGMLIWTHTLNFFVESDHHQVRQNTRKQSVWIVQLSSDVILTHLVLVRLSRSWLVCKWDCRGRPFPRSTITVPRLIGVARARNDHEVFTSLNSGGRKGRD